ncbi:MAG TPA: hypothetical protein VLM91_17365 [Candidatus Methylomirabilis sp.]|nr:hypothetical protein [Candidatus Methylomirabilis sp.]
MKTSLVLFAVAAVLGALSPGYSAQGAARVLGTPSNLGNGTVASYAEFDKSGAPKAIGVVFSGSALNELPTTPSDGHRCLDANNDGVIDLATECSGWHERVLPVPSEAGRRPDVPFKWALLNWNPQGHLPPGVFDKPHFDVHFYIEPIETIFALQRGTCGLEFLRCDQFVLARKPVPSNYVPPNFQDLGIAAPAMGNHLLDPTTHEFHGEPFTRHWIYGVYDGRVIFYEEMVARSYMLSKPDACFPIQSPDAVALTGYYPTRSCIRYTPAKDEYTVSMEDFVLRQASPPGPIRDAARSQP